MKWSQLYVQRTLQQIATVDCSADWFLCNHRAGYFNCYSHYGNMCVCLMGFLMAQRHRTNVTTLLQGG